MVDLSGATFPGLLAWAYRGEVSGEALFQELSKHHFTAEPHRSKLIVLAELERSMAQALLRVLDEHGVDPGDRNRSRLEGQTTARSLAATTWQEFLGLFGPVTEDAIDRYRRLRELAPDPDLPIFGTLVAHEQALRSFAIAELEVAREDSLLDARAVISSLADLTD